MAGPFEDLQEEINPWVASLLNTVPPNLPREPKLVRDAVHGFIILRPHEVAILDSPIVQRLRYIHQTAFANLVYPTATHTRFDHTIGVVAIADKVATALAAAGSIPENEAKHISAELRLAAMLHDVGHVLFSHLGEAVMSDRFRDRIQAIKRQEFLGAMRYFEAANIGEVLSYAIITCEAFKDFLQFVVNAYPGLSIDATRIAGLVIGRPPAADYAYEADIINGPFDADKLDYLLRDSHFSGIRSEVDVENILYGTRVLKKTGWPSYLVAMPSVVPHLEQILFSKMMLYHAVYHHHKVRALESMFKSIFEIVQQDPASHAPELRLASFRSFLELSEASFITSCLADDQIRPIANQLLNRRLIKRAPCPLNAYGHPGYEAPAGAD